MFVGDLRTFSWRAELIEDNRASFKLNATSKGKEVPWEEMELDSHCKLEGG